MSPRLASTVSSSRFLAPRARASLARASRVATLLLLACALAACGDKEAAGGPGKGGPGGGKGGDRPVPVTTVRLQPESFTDTLIAIGTVKARESVTVTAKVSEIVQTVHFDSGQEVRAGAPLVTLSDRQQQAALSEAQASANEADRLLRRQTELVQQQLIARAQVDNQRAARDAAQARVAQIRAQLADRVVRAPFSGVLGLRQVSPGALVTPGTPIATLDDISRVYVDFPLPESQLSRVGPGQRVDARAVAYPEQRFEGTVQTVDARIDPVTRAVQVRADLPNPQRLLRPGMLINVEISGATRSAMLLPEIAVTQVGRDSYVYRVGKDDAVEQVKVGLGSRSAGKVEIVEGLAAGDRVVVDGTGKLKPGDRISEAGAKAGAAAPADAKASAPAPAPAPPSAKQG
ncbi:efflux RND transporter periplasmic adaptor subunit [Lysobacter brunescens]|uniref:Efflux RND transporter periplasmic adaptor subunit n=1 Tax=Lysobacter brunescens TaxID=262323 RepID=A0ABW2YFN8_9GAMM